tara:strand:- start:2714 stop:3118 length:405 start_codon:yes stop_codon:yes gene_type:complete
MSFMNRMNEATGEDKEFAPLPEGTYPARLVEVKTEAHPDDGIMRTSLEFHITNGEHNGRRVWDKIKHSDTILWKAGAIYNGMGIQGELDGWNEWANAVYAQTNRTFLITTNNREYQDKVYTGVKRLQPNDEVPF